ncbi:hypothetical protein A8W25_29560 [Streptomyces sp. ERV7]|uniref:hypothetical protein n=1 Tax=Streptomyces sp. ERV7 TaxID=1322334 RepID=UPI0007F4FA37|nr:hypothetical protein [Streptomyces sp. ERV7]OAR22147.1 hypothetical protein A8W25_29560 [Streptomyces sp. ERV7]
MSDVPDVLGGDVVALLGEAVEARFGLVLPELARRVQAAPEASPAATHLVHWYGLLAQAQEVLEKAEDALVAALETAVGEGLDDPVMDLAQQVNTAVELRDARAATVRFLLEAPVEQTRSRPRPVPRVSTTLPAAAPAQPARIRGALR